MSRISGTFKTLVVATLFFVFIFSSFKAEEGVFKGNEAPDFRLKPVGGGNPVMLSKYRGKPVVIVFWATWCGPCKRELPALKELYTKYSPKGVVFLSVAVGWRQTEENIARFQALQQIPYPVLWDKSNEVSDQYNVHSIPTNLILDQDGIVRYREFALTSEAEDVLSAMVKAGD